MLLSTKNLAGHGLNAKDGEIGEVDSLLFDDRDWRIRYVVARTFKWLGREVLIAPEAFGKPDYEGRTIGVSLTNAQIKASPSIDVDPPVSRQALAQLHGHYGWNIWWTMPGVPLAVPPAGPAPDAVDADPHLRSTAALLGCGIRAGDDDLGHVEDFVVDTQAWCIRYVIVDTRNWLPGRHVIVPPDAVENIDWDERRVELALSREQVDASPDFDPTDPVNREPELQVYDFHGRKHPKPN